MEFSLTVVAFFSVRDESQYVENLHNVSAMHVAETSDLHFLKLFYYRLDFLR